MSRFAVALLVAVTAVVGCGSDPPVAPSEPAVAASPSLSPSPTTSPSPDPAGVELPEPIALPALPDEGIAVQEGRAVVLIGVDGRTYFRLPGFQVEDTAGAAGVWLGRGRIDFRLDFARRRLIPVSRKRARLLVYEGKEATLPIPPGTRHPELGVVGHWRYSFDAADGSILGQWSGECEVPTAYWIAPGGAPQIITGHGDLSEAPESEALGWSDSGLAIVVLGPGYCGGSGDPPGVYAFSAPGQGVLLYETDSSSVDMWGR